jgi:hypothetical protein
MVGVVSTGSEIRTSVGTPPLLAGCLICKLEIVKPQRVAVTLRYM